jgi:hypothetical protein
MDKMIVVTFPESQTLCEYDGFLDNVELINSDRGVELYGGSAYLVDEDWYNDIKANKIAKREYTDEELENGLTINWSYPIPEYKEIDDFDME